MKQITFMSFDPSLRNTGVVWGYIEEDRLIPQECDLIITSPSKGKKVRKSSDLIRRSKEINTKIQHLLAAVNPKITFIETPSGSQNASSARSYAISCYTAALIEPAPIQVTPQELKKKAFGVLSVPKAKIIKYVHEKYPDLELPTHTKNNEQVISTTKAEHICDAVVAAEVGMRTYHYNQIREFF